jgi:hypothetical protein
VELVLLVLALDCPQAKCLKYRYRYEKMNKFLLLA